MKNNKKDIAYKIDTLKFYNLHLINLVNVLKNIGLYETLDEEGANLYMTGIVDNAALCETAVQELFGEYFDFNIYSLYFEDDLTEYYVIDKLLEWFNDYEKTYSFTAWVEQHKNEIKSLLAEKLDKDVDLNDI